MVDFSEPEAVTAIERMAREASQSEQRNGISGATLMKLSILEWFGLDMS